MSIWIVTTGSSDVELETDRNWRQLYNEYNKHISEFQNCSKFQGISRFKDENQKNKTTFLVPPRPLGLVYGKYCPENKRSDRYQADLSFPLLDVFIPQLQEELKSNSGNDTLKVFVLLTDQTELFKGRINDEKCPFWYDTCELKPILEWYFQKELGITPEFITINYQGECGIDHWNSMLKEVKSKISKSLENIPQDEVVYVSHQAGTPAISSAVQFVTIGKFTTVKFLVSNQSYDSEQATTKYSPEIIPSSEYWQEMQIQKAKKLITDGFPGSALQLIGGIPNIKPESITELQEQVDIFNIKATVANPETDEFKPDNAIERVRDGLDMIEFFFKQENYLSGVALLAAAQETYMKATIYYLVKKLNKTVAGVDVINLVRWDNSGLFLKSKRSIEIIPGFQPNTDLDTDLADMLKFPVPEQIDENNKDSDYTRFWKFYIYQGLSHHQFLMGKIYRNNQEENTQNDFSLNNTRSLKWLEELAADKEQVTWPLLTWTCHHIREREDDIRNQLMHNLRGVEKKDVIDYLHGYPNDSNTNNVAINYEQSVQAVYVEQVKKPFIKAMHCLGLLDSGSSGNKLQSTLNELAAELQVVEK